MLIALNKPFGVISKFSPEPGKQTLADYVRVRNVYPAGRLDTDSEGLLLLTDDGALQARIANPRYKLAKYVCVMFCATALSFVQTFARADVIGAEQFVNTLDRRATIERINVVLARSEVRQELERLGVDPDDATARVAALNDQELVLLADNLEGLPAGGDLLAVRLQAGRHARPSASDGQLMRVLTTRWRNSAAFCSAGDSRQKVICWPSVQRLVVIE